MAISSARRVAFDVLRRVAAEDAYAADLLYAEIEPGTKKTDASLATELTLGVLRQQRLLDFLLERYLERRCDQSEEHTSELQSRENLVCRLLLEKKKKKKKDKIKISKKTNSKN